jgi:hypothetical protein
MEQTERLSGSLRQASDQLRAMGQGRGAPSGVVSDLTNQLADVTGGMAGRLESGGLDGAIADVKRFARNRPAVFLAAAAGAGFVVGRLLKAVDTRAVVEAAKESVQDGGTSSLAGSETSGELPSAGGTAAADPAPSAVRGAVV